MKSDVTTLEKQAFIYTPGIIFTILFVLVGICIFALMGIDEGVGKQLRTLVLLMPCLIASLVMDVFLRILFRKDIKYKALYVWVTELVAMVTGYFLFLKA